MFLLHIESFKNVSIKQSTNIKQLKSLKYQLINKTLLLKAFKLMKNRIKYDSILQKVKISKKHVKFIIGISLLNTNTYIHITDIKGRIRFFTTAGSIGLTGYQKIKKPAILLKLIQFTLSKSTFLINATVILHLQNFTKFDILSILSLLKKYLIVDVIKVYNNTPHNGCRPKKLKRKKHRKIMFKESHGLKK